MLYKAGVLLTKAEELKFRKKVGELIRQARTNAKVKQEVLSAHLGFKSRISVANIENGNQNVQLTTLIEIADYLKVLITDLIPPLESIRGEVNPALTKNIGKEVIDDPLSYEKIIDFIRLTTSKKS